MKTKLIAPITHEIPFEQVLANRGVENIENFFDISFASVQTPMALENMDIAVGMFIHHMHDRSKTVIIVDSDVDGFTSAAVLSNYIHARNEFFKDPPMELHYLFHDDKQHGLYPDMMAKVRALNPQFLIIPDASGTNAQYAALNEIGIDVLVLDHHDTEDTGDGANTIVVNNQHSPEYKNKALSGVGVVYQFCCAVDESLGVRFAEQWLDLVAVGLVADVMDMRFDETRFLTQAGLNNPRSQFVLQCLETYDYQMQGNLTPHSVAFYIAPMINAVNRIGTQAEKELLFRSLIDKESVVPTASGKRGARGEMVPLIMEALRQGTNAKSRQTRRQDKLAQLIDDVIAEEGLLKNKVLIVTIDDFDKDQRALSGLIANKLIDLYQRPVMLLFWNEEKEEYHGSARAPSDVEAFANFRQQCVDSELFIYASGHEQAHGVGVSAENVGEVQDYFNARYDGVDVSPTYNCDFIVDARDASLPDIILNLGEYGHVWGTGIKEPLIAVTGVSIGKSNSVLFTKGRVPTLKLSLPNDVSCIRFNSSQEEFDSIVPKYDGGTEVCNEATIIGRASINEWQGSVTPQLKIVDYIIEGPKYNF